MVWCSADVTNAVSECPDNITAAICAWQVIIGTRWHLSLAVCLVLYCFFILCPDLAKPSYYSVLLPCLQHCFLADEINLLFMTVNILAELKIDQCQLVYMLLDYIKWQLYFRQMLSVIFSVRERTLVSKDSKNETHVKLKKKLVYFFSTQEAPNEKLLTFSLKWNQKKCHLSHVLTLINTGFLPIKTDQKKGCC